MYDLFQALDSLGIKYLLYADDIFIYCTDVSLTAFQGKLQEALRWLPNDANTGNFRYVLTSAMQ